jgi:hypothetical protein
LRYEYHDPDRDRTIPDTPAEYQQKTRWKNDPTKAGLDLKPWRGDSGATAKAD